MIETFEYLLTMLSSHAYLAVFVLLVISGFGLPIPEDLVVVAAGVVAHQANVNPIFMLGLCFFGLIIADYISFYLGRRFGANMLHRRWVKRLVHPRRILWARRQVHGHGAWVIFSCRFIPGSRWATMIVAGMLHMSRWKFVLADALALLITVLIQFFLGWIFADQIIPVLRTYYQELLIGLAVFGVISLVAYIVWRKRGGARLMTLIRRHGPRLRRATNA